MSQYTGKNLHRALAVRGTSEAEEILLDAYQDIRRAEKEPEHYRMLDFFRVLRGMLSSLKKGDTLQGDDPEHAEIARSIFAALEKRR